MNLSIETLEEGGCGSANQSAPSESWQRTAFRAGDDWTGHYFIPTSSFSNSISSSFLTENSSFVQKKGPPTQKH